MRGWTPALSLRRLWWRRSALGTAVSPSIPALARVCGPPRLAADAWPRWLMFQSISDQESWFEDMHVIATGRLASWRVDESPELGGQLELPAHASTTLPELTDAVQSAVGRHAGPGTETFIYYSGGTDSSVLAVATARAIAEPVSLRTAALDHATFTANVRQTQHAARRLGLPHRIDTSTATDFAEHVVASTTALAQPLVDWYPLLAPLARRAAAEGHTIGLDGGGANALLGRSMALSASLVEHVAGLVRGGASLQPRDMLSIAAARGIAITGPLEVDESRWPALLLREATVFADETHPEHPLNQRDLLHPLECEEAFGTHEVQRLLEQRRVQAHARFKGRNLAERLHLRYLAGAAHYYGSQCLALAEMHGVRCRKPWFDESFVRTALGVDPATRLQRGNDFKPVMKDLLVQWDLRDLAWTHSAPWYSAAVDQLLYAWMTHGPLAALVAQMDRPSFLGVAAFERLRRYPSRMFLRCLMFDLFAKAISRHPPLSEGAQ